MSAHPHVPALGHSGKQSGRKFEMEVIVASKNPVKLASKQQDFESYFTHEQIEYTCVEAASDVSEQPMSSEETIRGAINRATNASRREADFAVGIEGGMSFYKIDNREYGVEICWVAVVDCKTGEHEIACSPGFSVLPHIVERMHQGQNLSEAMEQEYGIKNLGQKNGYIGWLSNDFITRQSSNYEAILLALSSLAKEAT